MTDPLDSTVTDGGLNSSDTQDWNKDRPAIRVPWYLSFGALILVAGVIFLIGAIAYKVSGLFQPKPAAVANAAPSAALGAPPQNSDKDAEIAALRSQIAVLQGQSATTAAPPAYAADPAALAALSARLDRVEANQRAFARAAMVANAAQALDMTARSGAPFATQLAVVEPGLDDPNVLAPLRPYADKGVPTVVDLAVRFPSEAAKANIAARNDGGDNSLLTRALHFMGSFVSIRRTDDVTGQGTQAVLQHAENSLNGGDLAAAVASLETLKPAPHKALEPWLAEAHARLLVDDTTQRVAASALNRLAGVTATAPATVPGAAL